MFVKMQCDNPIGGVSCTRSKKNQWPEWILANPGSSGERTAVKTDTVVAVHSSHKGCDIRQ